MPNPFPGLRPFEADEEHLFFGREKEIDELLRRLRATRFLAVVGTSGSGKSSLVRSGLIPSLQGGFMAGGSSSWRIAVMRPGADPIGHLAAALSAPGLFNTADDSAADEGTLRAMTEATLRRGTLGLAQAVRHARVSSHDNLIVIVDQFEELFRFRRGPIANSRAEAIAFVRLLLEAAHQQEFPVYIVLTMRSDFIGDCMDFPGLPEAVNDGLYLVGRMSRDSLRKAITGPVAVARGTIAPRLVNRVLNDLNDDHDQLPRVQHALMRTWEHWEQSGRRDAIDVANYDAIGTFSTALSQHAEEAYRDASNRGAGAITERLFKALTDTFSDPRGVRRPTAISQLAAVCEAPEDNVIAAVDVFRQAGRSFLMPPPTVALTSTSVVDISHESLMRCWTRLGNWAQQERESATFYMRLSQAAEWNAEGSAALWGSPELELAERWRTDTHPTAAWAHRYSEGLDRALAFLDTSLNAQQREANTRDRERRAKLRRVQAVATVFGLLFVAAAAFGYLAWRERGRAEQNLALARNAVDDSLASADRDTARADADLPQVEELRHELLQKAGVFYAQLLRQAPTNEASRRDAAFGHVRLGQVNRLTGNSVQAESEYRAATAAFESLTSAYPNNTDYLAAMGSAYNWLGETLRPDIAKFADAEGAYNKAIQIQEPLGTAAGASAQTVEELARSHYNRGILLAGQTDRAAASESDFREAIRLLEPLQDKDDRAAQELARADNNLGSLFATVTPDKTDEVRALWQKAIAIDERLVVKVPENREYKLELATYCGNLAALQNEAGDAEEADRRSLEAVGLLEGLARVSPTLAVTRADAHDLRAAVLQAHDAASAQREYAAALDLFEQYRADPHVWALPDFHERFADLLVNLAALPAPGPLLARAVAVYAEVCRSISMSGSQSDARSAITALSRIVDRIPKPDQDLLTAAVAALQRKLQGETR